MNNNYGRLLEYHDKEYFEDPYSGYKIVRRLAQKTESNKARIELPQEGQKIKLVDSRVCYHLDAESHLIPDNDHYAKMINKTTLYVNN